MYSERRSSNRTKVLMGWLCLLASAALAAQTATPAASPSASPSAEPRMVPLVSDTCPVVHVNDRITLDWYPGFDYENLVTNLRTFTLSLSPVEADGVNVNDHRRFALGKGPVHNKMTPIANGYFHIEIPVPRKLPPGTYHVVDARATPLLPPEYRYLNLVMTNSPADSRFCITMVGTTPGAQPQSNNEAP